MSNGRVLRVSHRVVLRGRRPTWLAGVWGDCWSPAAAPREASVAVGVTSVPPRPDATVLTKEDNR
jgi:hypothetical protein